MDEPIVVRNKFLTEETRGLVQTLTNIGWEYDWYSKTYDGRKTVPHWHVKIAEGYESEDNADQISIPAVSTIWKKVIEEYGHHRLHRCYANGHDHGDDGAIHLDSPLDNAVTFLVYIMDQYWNPDYGGETLIYDSARERVIAGSLPQQGRLLKFPGCLPHRGCAPTKICPIMRVVLVFKSFKDQL